MESEARSRAVSQALCRLLDITVAAFGIVIFSPAMLLAVMLIALELKGSIFFAHERIGFGGRPFLVYKFRTMCKDGDKVLSRHLAENPAAAEEWLRDHKLRDDPRVSRLGRFLRKFSVDELPQLFNVTLGDMSIVGPRPIVAAEVPRYGSFFESYCSVRPGITGVWQVSGRNDISYQRRVEMDALYARRKSALLDLRLMLATIPAVLMRRGSY